MPFCLWCPQRTLFIHSRTFLLSLKVPLGSSVCLPLPCQTCHSRETHCDPPNTCRVSAHFWYPSVCVIIIFNHVFCFFPFSFSFPDKNGSKNLGKFLSSPIREKGHIQLSYSDGDECGGTKINTNITLVCKPGTRYKRAVPSWASPAAAAFFSFRLAAGACPGDEAERARAEHRGSRSVSVGPLDSIPSPSPSPSPAQRWRNHMVPRGGDGETIWCPGGSCCSFPDELRSWHGFLFLRPGAG